MGKYRVEAINSNTPTIIDFVIKLNDYQKPLTFLPGQYATISYKKRGRYSAVRCFSLASSPLDQSRVEFGIRVNGKYTNALKKLKTGDDIILSGPYGSFIFEPDIHKELVLCAGGIGITPFMSKVRYATSLQLSNKINLVISARSNTEIPYYKELQELSHKNHNLKIIYVIDSGDLPKSTNSQLFFSGRINNEILQIAAKQLDNPLYFLCGPPPFMNSVKFMLTSRGVTPEKIITEAFSQGPAKKINDTRDWPSTIYLAGAFSIFIASGIVIINELLKTIPPSLLPTTLLNSQNQAFSGRQQDLDKMVNELQSSIDSSKTSPALNTAEKAAKDAQAATLQAAQPTSSVNNSPTNTNNSTSPNTAPPASAPPPAPVCTTNASGVTVCQ